MLQSFQNFFKPPKQHPRNYLKTQRLQKDNLNIVITGGTKGLGKSLAIEFANRGDNVHIISRGNIPMDDTLKQYSNRIKQFKCDVADSKQLTTILPIVQYSFPNPEIDIWINNAGQSGGCRPLNDLTYTKIHDIIDTNLLGTIISCKMLYPVLKTQSTGGAIFNLAGAGSDGNATPNYSIYGSTKSGLIQFTKSIQQEWKQDNVDVHTISPGLMWTDLLTDNLSNQLPQNTVDMVEFLSSHPDVVAQYLVPRIKNAYYYKETDNIKFMTILRVLGNSVARPLKPFTRE